MSDNGRYITMSIFCPRTHHSYVRATRKTQTFVFYPKTTISSLDMTSVGFYYTNVSAANQRSHASVKETIHLSVTIALAVHL